jgi:NADH-quinone oxidoreductase subunit J
VVIGKNSIFSALFLILAFCNVSSLLFLLKLEFLPILFLVVYVGAIAVLFIFVLMMLNIKQIELKNESVYYVPIATLFVFVFLFEMFALVRSEFVPLLFLNNSNVFFITDFITASLFSVEFSFNYILNDNIVKIGNILFSEYFFHFIISGYVLLFAMIGVIVLTLHKKFITKSQVLYAQTLREFNASLVFYS